MGIGDFFRNLFKKKNKDIEEEHCDCCAEEEPSQPQPVNDEPKTAEENKPL